jgi:hypothetical protein
MNTASAYSESPLDSSKHIIPQLLCPVQRSLMQVAGHSQLLVSQCDHGVDARGTARGDVACNERDER